MHQHGKWLLGMQRTQVSPRFGTPKFPLNRWFLEEVDVGPCPVLESLAWTSRYVQVHPPKQTWDSYPKKWAYCMAIFCDGFFLNTPLKTNMTLGKSQCSIGSTSSFMVDVPASHVSFRGDNRRNHHQHPYVESQSHSPRENTVFFCHITRIVCKNPTEEKHETLVNQKKKTEFNS